METVSIITFPHNLNIAPRFYDGYFGKIPIIVILVVANAVPAQLYIQRVAVAMLI